MGLVNKHQDGCRLIVFGGVNGGKATYICDPGEEDELARKERLRVAKELLEAGAGEGEDPQEALARAARIREVSNWLSDNNLSKFTQMFMRHEVDFPTLQVGECSSSYIRLLHATSAHHLLRILFLTCVSHCSPAPPPSSYFFGGRVNLDAFFHSCSFFTRLT
jgi:hypothetical protein